MIKDTTITLSCVQPGLWLYDANENADVLTSKNRNIVCRIPGEKMQIVTSARKVLSLCCHRDGNEIRKSTLTNGRRLEVHCKSDLSEMFLGCIPV